MEQTNERAYFAIQTAIITMELHEMLEKTKKIEAELMQEINSRVSTTDFYTPPPETQNSQPRKKRIKLESFVNATDSSRAPAIVLRRLLN